MAYKVTQQKAVEVELFHEQGKCTCSVSGSLMVRELHELVRMTIGLTREGAKIFRLFAGPLGAPTKLLQEDDPLPAQERLCFQRWCFDIAEEAKASHGDQTALHLLYTECQYYIGKGRIRPDQAQQLELTELLDPFFPTELQYLECARRAKGYAGYAAEECTVTETLQSNDYVVRYGDVVSCCLTQEALLIENSSCSVHGKWRWTAVKRWQLAGPNVVRFEVVVHKQNAAVLCWLALETTQAHFLFTSATSICHAMAGTLADVQASRAAKVITKNAGILGGFLNTHFVDTKQLSSIEETRPE